MGYGWGWGWGRGRGGWGGGWGRGPGGPPQPPPSVNAPQLPPPAPGSLRVVAGVEVPAGLESPIAARFTRAPYLAFADVGGGRVLWHTCLQNAFAELPRGAGVALAQWLAANGVRMVVAAHVGPNAAMVLQQSGIAIKTVQPGTRFLDALRSLGLLQ